MTLRILAIKRSEIKQLSRERLLLLGARCAMRVEPWLPPDTETMWSRGLEHVVASAFSESDPADAPTLRRRLSDRGVIACDSMRFVDKTFGECMSYTTLFRSALRDCAPFWVGRAPDWAKRPDAVDL